MEREVAALNAESLEMTKEEERALEGTRPREEPIVPSQPRSIPLSTLTTRSIVDALIAPDGPLKDYMDISPPSERAFALRAAVASMKIQEWLEEVVAWPWPADGGSTGFETPETRSEESSVQTVYIGSLLAAEIPRYERRLDEIYRGLEELDVEEIKADLLRHHIVPIPRPGSPALDSQQSRHTLTYTQMNDLTALVTAVIVQSLPNLSKLVSLANAWTVRLLVLGHMPSLLSALDEVEGALRSAWYLAASNESRAGRPDSIPPLASTKSEFASVKSTLEGKVARAGRKLDFMLDALEGCLDTLPEDWVDRMDRVEARYSDWVASCERSIREDEWAGILMSARPQGRAADSTQVFRAGRQPALADAALIVESKGSMGKPARKAFQELGALRSYDGTVVEQGGDNKNEAGEIDGRVSDWASDEDMSEPELPDFRPLYVRRRGSGDSSSSVQELESPFLGLSSDFPDHGTPEAARTCVEAHSSPSYSSSAPSTPPDRHKMRFGTRLSVAATPTIAEPLDESRPNTRTNTCTRQKTDESESPSKLSDVSIDDQFQQQLGVILAKVPAKIQLSSQPARARARLDPPSFKVPARKSSGPELYPRSQSSLSTRSTRSTVSRPGSPSFLLAPAYRQSRGYRQGSQDIKLYHLSRPNGEKPIKLFIRCVGEKGERVMVRVGGGWADLGEYLREYASHHGRRYAEGKVELRDLSRSPAGARRSSPASRSTSALEMRPVTPLDVGKVRKLPGEDGRVGRPKTPLATLAADSPSPWSTSTRSRSSSRLSWAEDDASLGMAGPRAKRMEMSDESKAWVEHVKEKVRIASSGSDRKFHDGPALDGHFGDLGKVGGTKRLFKKQV